MRRTTLASLVAGAFALGAFAVDLILLPKGYTGLIPAYIGAVVVVVSQLLAEFNKGYEIRRREKDR